MKNKLGLIALASYLTELNTIGDGRHVDSKKFNGRITLKDSFEHYSNDTEIDMQLSLISIESVYDCALNRKVGSYVSS